MASMLLYVTLYLQLVWPGRIRGERSGAVPLYREFRASGVEVYRHRPWMDRFFLPVHWLDRRFRPHVWVSSERPR